ncbi:hypothetical protein ABK040_005752 [Willaertia magna]
MQRIIGTCSHLLSRSNLIKKSLNSSIFKCYSGTLFNRVNSFNTKTSSCISVSSILNQSNVQIRNRRITRHAKAPVGRKLKTKSAAAKRFRVTGSGKIKRKQAGKRHHAWSKNRKRINRLGKTVFLTNKADKKKIARFLNFKV